MLLLQVLVGTDRQGSSLSGLLLCLCEWIHCFIGISGLFFSLETMSLLASNLLALNSWSQGWPKLLFLLPPSPEGWVEVCTTTPSFMWSNKATFPKLSVFIPIYYLFLYAFTYFQYWGWKLGILACYLSSLPVRYLYSLVKFPIFYYLLVSGSDARDWEMNKASKKHLGGKEGRHYWYGVINHVAHCRELGSRWRERHVS